MDFNSLTLPLETAKEPKLTGSNLAKVNGFLRALKICGTVFFGRKEVKLRIPFHTFTAYK
jgi:hypothetical protein